MKAIRSATKASIHPTAIRMALGHLSVTGAVAFLAFMARLSALSSEASGGQAGMDFFTYLLKLLQAPVALILWLMKSYGMPNDAILPIPILLLLVIPSSLLYGYAIVFLLGGASPRQTDQKPEDALSY